MSSNFRLTEAKAKYGPILIRLENPSKQTAAALMVSALLVNILILVAVFYFLIGNIIALLEGSTDPWTIFWTIVLSLYLINAVTD